ncbi:MAG TPA: transglycosylase SLT domain-containing protein [Phototrophicaceae bacterium]|jgi:hypothetical protein|nr:transglycosylase SLT domain-containing protein [Phototrophicaceae bacterium]
MTIRSRPSISQRRSLTFQWNEEQVRSSLIQHLPAWLLLMAILGIILPYVVGGVVQVGVGVVGTVVQAVPQAVEGAVASIGNLFHGSSGSTAIAPLFTDQVKYWAADIDRWSQEHQLDPNLLATVMQIESCGHPTVSSSSGAQGLFQVMPFHFASNENQIDPDTNALRGADFLKSCMDWANDDPGKALACYNGGPSVLQTSYTSWAPETQRYYYWGTGIYNDAKDNQSSSTRLNEWLSAGGQRLCQMASSVQSN